MASRETIKHTISVVEPKGASIGDEWFDPDSPGILYKRTVRNNIMGWYPIILDSPPEVSLNGAETLSNKTLVSPELTVAPYVNGSYRSNIVAVAALDIDCSLGNYFSKTIAGNSAFTFSNAPTSRAYSFTLELNHTSGSVTWPGTVTWPGAVTPSLTTARTHLFMFVTDDGGTRWRGAALINFNT